MQIRAYKFFEYIRRGKQIFSHNNSCCTAPISNAVGDFSSQAPNIAANSLIKPLEEDKVDIYANVPSRILAKTMIKKRGSEEFVEANIRQKIIDDRPYLSSGEKVFRLEIEHDGEVLIKTNYPIVRPEQLYDADGSVNSTYNLGLPILFTSKTAAGENYSHLQETVDRFCVHESQKVGLGGKIWGDAMSDACPLHWGRGFKCVDYVQNFTKSQKNKYDKVMENAYKSYVSARKSGLQIYDAKKSLNVYPQYGDKMVLSPEKIQEYLDGFNSSFKLLSP